MNARLLITATVAITLTALSLLPGCTQQSASRPNAYVVTSNTTPPPVLPPVGFTPPPTTPPPPPTVAAAPAPAAAAGPELSAAPLIISNAPPTAPEPLPTAEPVAPANVRLSQAMREIIRLSQAGVDETIMLTYATNSPALFLLGAEEIVYLNDLGVPSSVITTMMQRDQALKVAWNLSTPTAPPATNSAPIAVAPTYVNPPAQAEAPPAAEPVYVSDNYFYDNLSPYGTWINVNGYGRVWRPTVVVTTPGWQPYRDRGRWIYTDAGWYWWSDYSWGSIAFHYGRWFSHPRWGWCWWPDTVWAPSWVTWRYDNSYCGWAPLPPRSYYRPGFGFYYQDRHVGIGFDFGYSYNYYSYVPWSRFHDPRPYNHCLPPGRSVVIHNQTTVINDFSSGRNNTVVNRGIPSDRVREHSRVETRPVSLREESLPASGPRAARLERDGRTLVVNRPTLTSATAPTAPNPRAGERGDNRFNGISSGPNPAVTAPREARPVTTRPTPGQNLGPATPTVRPENRPEREAPARREERPTNPERPTTVVSTPPPAPAPSGPTPARTTTPIFSKPVVVQTTPQLPTRPIVTPATSPAETPGPRANFNGGANRNPGAPGESAVTRPQPGAPTQNFTAPANRPEAMPNRELPTREIRTAPGVAPERPGRAATYERSQTAPPTPSFTPSAPARPSYTPPSQPAAPRVESRPEPGRSESRSESRPSNNDRAESRSAPGSNPRSR